MDVLQNLLRQQKPLLNAEAMPRVLDLLWSRLGGLNGKFFEAGWGNLGIVNLQEDLELIKQWPPKQMQIDWKLLQQGSWEGTPYKLFEGSFRTPCVRRIYDALPQESRTGRVQLLLPDGPPTSTLSSAASTASSSSSSGIITSNVPSGGSSSRGRGWHYNGPTAANTADTNSSSSSSRRGDDSALFGAGGCVSAAVLHLAATGDQGFGRRLKLGGPLLSQGVAQLVLESPYYGARRPPQQRGSKLCAVSDLLALGWATIYESLCLLHWLEASGINTRGICGLSMGGVHAAMTAGLCPRPLAITPLLAPRSAAVAYCDGALAPLMAWGALLTDRDWANNHVEQVVAEASQPVVTLDRARYVELQHRLEQRMAAADASLHENQQQEPQQRQQQQCQAPAQRQQAEAAIGSAEEAVAAVQQVAALAAVEEAAAAETAMAYHEQQLQQQQQQQQEGAASSRTSSRTSRTSSSSSSSDGSERSVPHWRRQIWRWQKDRSWRTSSSSSGYDSTDSNSSGSSSTDSSSWLGLGRPGFEPPPPDTFRRLRHVLETYTDVTRYPRPVRSDAAVLVAARHDVYVDMHSVKALQAHWPGSELRLVSGGHVSAFLMHQDAFRQAMRDSLARVAAPPPMPPTAAAQLQPDTAQDTSPLQPH